MAKKIYIVNLTEEERAFLLKSIKRGEHSARKINRARILLLADDGRIDREIAEALHTSVPTMQRIRQRLVELEVVDSVSDETVRRTLKNTMSSPG